MSKEMLSALTTLEEEKGIKKEVVVEAIEQAMTAAYKKQYGQSQSVEVIFDDKKGDFQIYTVREVVDEVFDSRLEISLDDALKINPHYEIGDKIRFEEKPKDFARTAAGAAKQVIMQKMREEERTIIYNEYSRYENEIMTGTVERFDNRFIFVNLGKIEAQLSKRDQIPGEKYEAHDRINVYVYKVEMTSKGTQVFVSRSHPELLKRLFEKEIPEVYDGTVEIMGIAREAGDRAKVVVRSNKENVDAIGTIVGVGGSRIQSVVKELHGENMDIIEWDEDPAVLIANSLKPASVEQVILNPETPRQAIVVVPDDQLSLAIGKRGQNVRLAAHVTNHKLDIKSSSDYEKYLAEQADQVIEEVEEVEELVGDVQGDELAVVEETIVTDSDEIEEFKAEEVEAEEAIEDFDEEVLD
ncbi:transcription termination factor NusA [Floricoccus penangensis]|uniref:Transcription termination/antitermination protein NusA n=1 Tax=Floricoccus penangensis TaxID=1859475 RepID=A0A9Q5JFC0_9LACT|nr:transcription termination factor NusA [Floricoccus penangensis]OFI46270.1 transcription termination/antitermination protein NusA [Floricoccus penangensis]URZ86992.1 transcription termination/antitermination protein NusA [Floricoccus penangensis]